MKYFEFGQEYPELMVLLHGGGVCCRGATWRSWVTRTAA